MTEKQLHKVKKQRMIFLMAAVVIIAALLFVFINGMRKRHKEAEEVKKGVAYLKELEGQDLKEIQTNIKTVRSSMGLELADSDEDAVWSEFSNSVILGDSRAVGFYFHEFLPEEQVMAEGGGIITDATKYLDQLKTLNPDMIFLCYGLNDVGLGQWPDADDYAKDYAKVVKKLQKALPDATIYINSILPAVGVGLDADPDYPRIDEYNDALQKMCEEEDWPYIDNTQLAKEHENLYQEDGLHVETEFYKYWAANMLTEVEE